MKLIKFNNEVNKMKQITTIDVTNMVGKKLEQMGFGDDGNNELNISKAGMFDVLDALSGIDNSKFSVEDAEKEFKKRMGE